MQSTSIQTFMDQHGISMQLMKMSQAKPVHADLNEEMDRYRCQIRRPGKEMYVYVATPAEEGALTPSDVLFMLILDASGCEMFKDYYARHDEFKQIFSDSTEKRDEFDDFWLEYESRYRQSQKLRTFLGNHLYKKLIDRFGFDN